MLLPPFAQEPAGTRRFRRRGSISAGSDADQRRPRLVFGIRIVPQRAALLVFGRAGTCPLGPRDAPAAAKRDQTQQSGRQRTGAFHGHHSPSPRSRWFTLPGIIGGRGLYAPNAFGERRIVSIRIIPGGLSPLLRRSPKSDEFIVVSGCPDKRRRPPTTGAGGLRKERETGIEPATSSLGS